MPKSSGPETLTPNQLALRSALCTAFTCGYILLLCPLIPVMKATTPSVLLRMPAILPLVLGMYWSYRYSDRIGKGIKAKLWNAAQIKRLQDVLNHPVTGAIQLSCLVLWFAMNVVGMVFMLLATKPLLQFLSLIFLVMFMSISNLKTSLRSAEPPAAGLQLSLRDDKTLESEQWGEHKTSPSL